jgi:hypothetical protein
MVSNGAAAINIFGLGELVNPQVSIAQASEVEHTMMVGTHAPVASVQDTEEKTREEFQERLHHIESQIGFAIGGSAPSRAPAEETRDDDFADAREPDPPEEARAADVQPETRARPIMSAEGIRYTEEARKHDRISSAMSSMSLSSSVDFLADEREEDEKLSMIEEINELLDIMRDSGEEPRDFHVPTMDDPISTITSTLKLLRRNNDRQRYRSVADDCIMLAATSLEQICNGRREFFGVRPDLRGWSTHVRAKLRRMRPDTSQIAGSLMNNYNFGVAGRIILELLPSLITFARDHSGTTPAPPESAPAVDMSGALSRLRGV